MQLLENVKAGFALEVKKKLVLSFSAIKRRPAMCSTSVCVPFLFTLHFLQRNKNSFNKLFNVGINSFCCREILQSDWILVFSWYMFSSKLDLIGEEFDWTYIC